MMRALFPVARWKCCIVALLLSGIPSSVRGQTIATVDCTSGRLGVAEREICTSPELKQLNEEIDVLTRRLEMSLRGAARDALLDTEGPFIVQRNSCQNASGPVRACLQRLAEARREALNSAEKSPAAIISEIDRYEFLGVAFFVKYGERLVGRYVSVFGCMSLEPGPNPVERIHGVIHASCANPSGPAVPVVFRSMTASAAASFYDAKQPTSYWRGTVERRDTGVVLAQVDP